MSLLKSMRKRLQMQRHRVERKKAGGKKADEKATAEIWRLTDICRQT
jgi:hypothetical protein